MISIYKIVNPNGEVYIGQTKNVKQRFANYKNMNCAGQRKLLASFMNFGIEAHDFSIICECKNRDAAKEAEVKYINEYNSFANGLNGTPYSSGRPPISGERKIGVSVYIDPNKLKIVENIYGSLTQYIAAKLLQDNI